MGEKVAARQPTSRRNRKKPQGNKKKMLRDCKNKLRRNKLRRIKGKNKRKKYYKRNQNK